MNLNEQTNRIKSLISKMGGVLLENEHIIDKYNDWSGFNTKEDAIDELNYLLSTDFPYGLSNIPDKVTLYRVLIIENNQKINEDEIGEHFVAQPEICYTRSFLEKIDVYDLLNNNTKLYILTCLTSKDNISIDKTIGNRLLYPREEEITVINPKKIKLINKEIIHHNQIN
jgi:hypothetical protein